MTDDQAASAARENAWRRHRARLPGGEEATVRTVTVEVTPDEAVALAPGEMPPGVQAQPDRQYAEDEIIAAIDNPSPCGR